MRTRHEEIKTIVEIMLEVNRYYGLSDEHFVSGVVDVLEKCGLADDSSEDALRLTVIDIYNNQMQHCLKQSFKRNIPELRTVVQERSLTHN